MKNNKGITLITLIITVIVMLILLGVSSEFIIDEEFFGTVDNVANNADNTIQTHQNKIDELIEEKEKIEESQKNS